MRNNEKFIAVGSEDINIIKDISGFENNSYPILDDKGIAKYGEGAYFVSWDWMLAKYSISLTPLLNN